MVIALITLCVNAQTKGNITNKLLEGTWDIELNTIDVSTGTMVFSIDKGNLIGMITAGEMAMLMDGILIKDRTVSFSIYNAENDIDVPILLSFPTNETFTGDIMGMYTLKGTKRKK